MEIKMKNKVLSSLLFYFFLGAEAFAASGTGGGDFLATLNTVQNWVKAASVVLAFILIVIGGLRIGNGEEKATTAGARLLCAGVFIGCAGWFVSNLIPY